MSNEWLGVTTLHVRPDVGAGDIAFALATHYQPKHDSSARGLILSGLMLGENEDIIAEKKWNKVCLDVTW